MLSRDLGVIVFECDAPRCPEILETETSAFGEAIDQFKEANWGRQFKDEWQHFCPSCEETRRANMAKLKGSY